MSLAQETQSELHSVQTTPTPRSTHLTSASSCVAGALRVRPLRRSSTIRGPGGRGRGVCAFLWAPFLCSRAHARPRQARSHAVTGQAAGAQPAGQAAPDDAARGASTQPGGHDNNTLSTAARRCATQVSLSAFAFLFSELVQYHQSRVSSVTELERKCVCARASLQRSPPAALLTAALPSLTWRRPGWMKLAMRWAAACWRSLSHGKGPTEGRLDCKASCSLCTPTCGAACLDGCVRPPAAECVRACLRARTCGDGTGTAPDPRSLRIRWRFTRMMSTSSATGTCW